MCVFGGQELVCSGGGERCCEKRNIWYLDGVQPFQGIEQVKRKKFTVCA